MKKGKMMMENRIDNKQLLSDDELVAMFFDENRQDLADDGFSQRVMHRLPSHSVRLSRIWTLVCSIAGIAFFFVTDGIGQLKHVLFNAIGHFVGFLSSVDFHGWSPLMIIVAIGLLMGFFAWNIAESLEADDRFSYSI